MNAYSKGNHANGSKEFCPKAEQSTKLIKGAAVKKVAQPPYGCGTIEVKSAYG